MKTLEQFLGKILFYHATTSPPLCSFIIAYSLPLVSHTQFLVIPTHFIFLITSF